MGNTVKQGEKLACTLYYYSNYEWPDATFYVGLTSDNGNTWEYLEELDPLDAGNYDNYYYSYDYDVYGFSYSYGYYYYLNVPASVKPGKYLAAFIEVPNNTGDCSYTSAYGTECTVERGCFNPSVSSIADINACAGSAVSINLTATIDPGYILYEWYKDGKPLTITKQPVYTFDPIGTADAGSYYVIVSDLCGKSIQSNTFKVTVNTPGVITQEPVGKTVCEGTSYKISLTATGSPLTYQWFKDGVPMPSVTGNSYTIPSATSADQGEYQVIVTGGCGDPDTSNKIVIAVPAKPVFNTPLEGGSFCPGSNVVIAPDVTGTILAYQWYKGDDPIIGATSRNLRIDAISTKNNGIYWVNVSVPGSELSGCPAFTKSNRVFVGAYEAPAILAQPVGFDACVGSDQRLSVQADGTGLTYQWFQNGTAVPNSNNYTLELDNVSAAQVGDYSVQITGACGLLSTSTVAHVAVYTSPSITTNPANTLVKVGETITLSVDVSGAQTIVWMKNEQEISRGTSNTLTINNAQLSDAGYYRAVATNVCGGVTSRLAMVGVTDPASLIPTIGIASTGLDVGDVPFGYSGQSTFTAVIVNPGNVDITVNGYSFSGANASEFTVLNGGTPYTLAPGATHDVTISYTPAAIAQSAAMLDVNSTATAGNSSVPVTGAGVLLYSTDKTLEFGIVDKAQATIKCFNISNTSSKVVTIDAITINGTYASEFRVTTTLPLVIDAGTTKEVCVEFTPLTVGVRTVQLAITSSSGGNSGVTANGTCEQAASVIEDGSVAGMKVYPNPASGNVTINTGAFVPTSVSIFDGQGALVRVIKPTQTIFTWDLNSTVGAPVASGTYNVVVANEAGSYRMMLQVAR